MTSRNKVDYNFDNIFTNIDSSSSSFNNYYDAFPFFGIRRFRREALEDAEGVTMDQDRSARSFQRARQNGLASREDTSDYILGGQISGKSFICLEGKSVTRG